MFTQKVVDDISSIHLYLRNYKHIFAKNYSINIYNLNKLF